MLVSRVSDSSGVTKVTASDSLLKGGVTLVQELPSLDLPTAPSLAPPPPLPLTNPPHLAQGGATLVQELPSLDLPSKLESIS